MDKRVILIVMDSVGVGELPDSASFGDAGSDTLGHIYETIDNFRLPNLEKMGIGNIDGVDLIKTEKPVASYGKMAEISPGKDTTTGHWEIGGLKLPSPFNVYPEGFPDEIISKFKLATGYDILCNKPASGTEIIKELGEEHMRTKKLIVYTSADSVFQIAAHEDVVPLEELYDICRKARNILDEYYVSRVIARPFVGTNKDDFVRTANRRDFSYYPIGKTILNALSENGKTVAAVGKIEDIFAGSGITLSVHTESNNDGVDKTLEYMDTVEDGLIFTNLVDFDSKYGHRNNPAGYAECLMEFDGRLPEIMNKMREDDLLIITADHGCDPTTESTDHSREYVPLIVYKKGCTPVNLGIRETYSDIAASIGDYLDVEYSCLGKSFIGEIFR
ncbi:MAG: phosphopentomutase [Anaerofustis stercorihominis]|nr:phosphopentomutase [Anaerofustis stercorihominis]